MFWLRPSPLPGRPGIFQRIRYNRWRNRVFLRCCGQKSSHVTMSKSRNILKQVEYLWISKKFNHSQHNISMYSRMDTPLLLSKSQQAEYPSRHLVGANLTIQLWGFVPWNWRTMVSPSTVLVVTWLQLLKPKFDPCSKGNQPSKSLKDFVMFQNHQDNFFWRHTALCFWS